MLSRLVAVFDKATGGSDIDRDVYCLEKLDETEFVLLPPGKSVSFCGYDNDEPQPSAKGETR
jgi:hypothetical protein